MCFNFACICQSNGFYFTGKFFFSSLSSPSSLWAESVSLSPSMKFLFLYRQQRIELHFILLVEKKMKNSFWCVTTKKENPRWSQAFGIFIVMSHHFRWYDKNVPQKPLTNKIEKPFHRKLSSERNKKSSK